MTAPVKRRVKRSGALSATTTRVRSQGTVRPALARVGSRWAGKWVLAYHPSWRAHVLPTGEIPWSLMTHISVFAALPKADGSVDDQFSQGSSAQGRAWAKGVCDGAKANGVKPVLSLGGAGADVAFAAALSTTALRDTFAANVVALADYLGCTIIDVDYEPVTPTNISVITDFGNRLRALRPSWQIIVAAGMINVNNASNQVTSDTSAWASTFDQVNCMNYGVGLDYGGWTSWASSPLYGEEVSSHPSSINGDVNAYMAKGIPARKIGVGVGGFAVVWKGVTALGQTGGTALTSDDDASMPDVRNEYLPLMERNWDPLSRSPYLSSSTPKGTLAATMISYEDAQSLGEKAAYVKRRGLGGFIIWQLADLYEPQRPAGQRFPYLDELAAAIKGGQVESVIPPAVTFSDLGNGAGAFLIPDTSEATYAVGGAVRAPGLHQATGSTTVVAAAGLGRVLMPGVPTSWTHTYSTSSFTFEDDFTTDLSKWNAHPDITIAGGNAVIPLSEAYPNMSSTTTFDMRGKAAAAHFTSLRNDASYETYLRLYVATTPANRVILLQSSGGLVARVETAGQALPGLTWLDSHDPATFPWIRIREEAGAFYFERSVDNAVWNTMGSGIAHSWSAQTLVVDVMAGRWDGADPATDVRLDRVEIV